MSYHHPFSPSSLGRRRLCPGSFLMEQKVKNPESTDYAKEGTMLHELIATRIEGRSWDSRALNADQINTLESSYEWFKSEVLTPLTDTVGPQVWKWVKCEESLGFWEHKDKELASSHGIPEWVECVISGTVDVLIDTRDGHAVIVDWKFGRAEVSDTASLLQLTGYSLLAFHKHEHIESIEAYIYQPRTGTIKKGLFDRDDIAVYEDAIKETISACLLKDPPLAASWDACAYCKAISICPEAHDKAFGDGQAVIERQLFNIEEMDADRLGQTLDDAKVADKFLKEVKAKCKEVMLDGHEATGWAIGERSGMKFIADNVDLAKNIEPHLSAGELLSVSSLSGVDFHTIADKLSGAVSLEALLPHAKISVPKLVTKLADQLIGGEESMSKAEARRQACEMIDPYVNEGPVIHALNRRKD